jgi:hypothetical protein
VLARRAVVYCAIVGVVLAIVPGIDPNSDAALYLTTVRAPGTLDVLPHRFRNLSPLIEWALPLSPHNAAVLVVFVALVATAILLARLCETYGVSASVATVIGGLFLLAPPSVGSLRAPLLVDPVSWLMIVAAVLLINRPAKAAALIVVGSLNRETALALVPDLWRRSRRAGAVALLAGVVAMVAVTFALSAIAGHGLIGHNGSTPPGSSLKHTNAGVIFDVATTFGLCWLLAFLGLRQTRRPLTALPIYCVLIVAQLLIESAEPRLVYYLFPVVLPLAAITLCSLSSRTRIVVVLATLATFANNQWASVLPKTARYAVVVLGFVVGAAILSRARAGVVAARNAQ